MSSAEVAARWEPGLSEAKKKSNAVEYPVVTFEDLIGNIAVSTQEEAQSHSQDNSDEDDSNDDDDDSGPDEFSGLDAFGAEKVEPPSSLRVSLFVWDIVRISDGCIRDPVEDQIAILIEALKDLQSAEYVPLDLLTVQRQVYFLRGDAEAIYIPLLFFFGCFDTKPHHH